MCEVPTTLCVFNTILRHGHVSSIQKKEEEQEQEESTYIMEQGPTWFTEREEREEGFQMLVSRPPSIPRNDGTATAPLWILRDSGLKGKGF